MDDLTTLLHEAVEHVEPTDRLAELRARTRRKSHARWYAVGGVSLATAAAVAAIAVLGNQGSPKADDNGPVTSPSPDASATAAESAYPVYYLGETPAGPRLYREFQQAPGFMWTEIAIQLLSRTPDDPDYRTPWPTGAFETAKVVGSGDSRLIEVTLADGSLHDRPEGMSKTEAGLAVEQVIYTLQAVAHERLPVQFRLNGNPIDQVLGVPTSEPLANAPQLDVLALVSVSNPAEGRDVEGSFSADGVASSFEGTVPWELQNAAGDVVLEGFAQAEGWMDKLYPWQTGPIDVSGLPAGQYTFVAMTDDPSGGAEGGGPTVDTRTITIR
jgi:hypothetical protein